MKGKIVRVIIFFYDHNNKKPSKANEYLFPSIVNHSLKSISTEVSEYESFMDFANQIEFLSKCNSCTTVGIQW